MRPEDGKKKKRGRRKTNRGLEHPVRRLFYDPGGEETSPFLATTETLLPFIFHHTDSRLQTLQALDVFFWRKKRLWVTVGLIRRRLGTSVSAARSLAKLASRLRVVSVKSSSFS